MKRAYKAPELEIFEFAVERGFAISSPGIDTTGQGNGGHWHDNGHNGGNSGGPNVGGGGGWDHGHGDKKNSGTGFTYGF